MKDLMTLNKHRQIRLELELYGVLGDSGGGVFAFKSPKDGRVLRVIASDQNGWDHVSVSKPSKTPTWEEMEWIKRMFFKPDEVCMQLHVQESEHISYHDHCLHIWRPHHAYVPLPPSWMVGVKKEPA